jgi:DNA processing protein
VKRFLVSDSNVARQVSKLIGDADDNAIEQSFARATFSLISEPGDRFAGSLIQHLSVEGVLELLISKSSEQKFRALLTENNSLEEFESKFGDFSSAFSDAIQRWMPRLKLTDVMAALEAAIACEAKLLTPANMSWPDQLGNLGDSTPHCLWGRGKDIESALANPAIAIVGSRISTSYGEWVTSEIVTDSSSRGLAIVSGGAYGIDAMAHRSALANDQVTIAFMAGGIDRLYPSGNASIFEKLVHRGALLAEQAPGASPTKWRFLQRNRLIAALGQATVVVEAGQRSGALNTVTHALQIDRPVGAVPGAITSQSSAGCNRLIAEGLVTTICHPGQAADLALGKAGWFQQELAGLGAFETRALDALEYKSMTEGQVASKAGLTLREVSIALGQLSLLGLVKQTDKGWLKLPLESEQRSEAGD